jgi:hypothetical protein
LHTVDGALLSILAFVLTIFRPAVRTIADTVTAFFPELMTVFDAVSGVLPTISSPILT